MIVAAAKILRMVLLIGRTLPSYLRSSFVDKMTDVSIRVMPGICPMSSISLSMASDDWVFTWAIRSNLPLTVCRGLDLRKPRQQPRHFDLPARFDGESHKSSHATEFQFPGQPYRIAGNNARFLQSFQPVLHRGARQPKLAGQPGHGLAAIHSQEGDQLLILGRDLDHAAKRRFLRQSDDLTVIIQHIAVCYPTARSRYSIAAPQSINCLRRFRWPLPP